MLAVDRGCNSEGGNTMNNPSPQQIADKPTKLRSNTVSEITVTDVGPVASLSIPIRPGVTILRGRNDCGKSETLKAVSRLAGGTDAVSCRDKAAAGCVEGLGVRLSVRQNARRTGELEALSIEGKLSVADLVSPPIKDPVAADRHRIKALLQLTCVEADAAMFAHLPGQEFLSFEALKSTDLVEMAAKIKRDLEAASRKEADAAERDDAKAFACKQAAEGVDVQSELDSAVLQAALEDSLFSHGEIVSQARSAKETQDRARLATERMAKEASPPDVDAIQEEVYRAGDLCAQWSQRAAMLTDELAKAKTAIAESNADHTAKQNALKLAKAHAESVTGWKETIAAGESVTCPTDEAIAAAATKVTQAREAIEKAAVIRAAKAKADESAMLYDEAKEHRKKAEALRESARSTDDVLSAAVASDSLKVRAGRLITQHPERGEVFYADRSDGTRWKIAIDEAIKRIRAMGAEQTAIIPIPQVAWSEIDPTNRIEIDRYAKEKSVSVLTAEATDGELRAERFGGAA